MTIKRAFKDLHDIGLITRELSKNKNEYHLSGPHKKVWDKANNFLQSPVIKKVFIPIVYVFSYGVLIIITIWERDVSRFRMVE